MKFLSLPCNSFKHLYCCSKIWMYRQSYEGCDSEVSQLIKVFTRNTFKKIPFSFPDSTLFAIFLGHRPWLPFLLTLSRLNDLIYVCHICTVVHPDLLSVYGTHLYKYMATYMADCNSENKKGLGVREMLVLFHNSFLGDVERTGSWISLKLICFIFKMRILLT